MAFWEKQDRSAGKSSCCHASLNDNLRLIPRTHSGREPTPKRSPPTSTLILWCKCAHEQAYTNTKYMHTQKHMH